MDSEEFYIWLFVRRFVLDHPKYSVHQSCEEIAKNAGKGGIWLAGRQVRREDGSLVVEPVRTVASADTLRRLYYAAEAMRKEDAMLAAAWDAALTGKPMGSPRISKPPT